MFLPDFAEIGCRAAVLLNSNEAEWIHRRVESLRIGSSLLTRRHVSFDFSIPPEAHCAEGVGETSRCYLPLAFIRKVPSLIWFDLRDEAGQPLPLVTKPDNQAADSAAFIELARLLVAESELPPLLDDELQARGLASDVLLPEVEAQLRDIVESEPKVALKALIRLYRGPERRFDAEFEMRHILARNAPFTELAEQLVTSRFLWVPAHHRIGERRIVKLAYEIATPNRLKLRRTFLAQIGARQVYWIQGPHMGNRSSYHLTIQAAQDLEILDADIVFDREDLSAEKQVERTVAHLHVSGRGENVSSLAYATIRVERQGYLSTAALACFAVCALLALCAGFSSDALEEHHIDGTITILLVVPGVLAAFMARPAYVLQDRRLLLGLRTLVLGVGVLSVAAALSAVTLSVRTTHDLWVAGATASGLVGFAHVLAAIFPRRNREATTTL